MLLDCPLCGKSVETANFKITRKAHGGFECPECKGLLQFSQPHAVFRRSLAVALSALLLVVFGVHRVIFVLLGSLILWPFMQLAVNGYCFRTMTTSLKPLTPKFTKFRLDDRDDGPIQLFDRRRKPVQPPRN